MYLRYDAIVILFVRLQNIRTPTLTMMWFPFCVFRHRLMWGFPVLLGREDDLTALKSWERSLNIEGRFLWLRAWNVSAWKFDNLHYDANERTPTTRAVRVAQWYKDQCSKSTSAPITCEVMGSVPGTLSSCDRDGDSLSSGFLRELRFPPTLHYKSPNIVYRAIGDSLSVYYVIC
jgi:hypothetical protein